MLERELDSSMELHIQSLKDDTPYKERLTKELDKYKEALKKDDRELADKLQGSIEILWMMFVAGHNQENDYQKNHKKI